MNLLTMLFSGKKKDNRSNHSFTDEDRELSKQIRLQKSEMVKQKLMNELELQNLTMEKRKLEIEAQISDLRNDLGEDESTDLDKTFMTAISSLLTKSGSGISSLSSHPQETKDSIHFQNYSEQELTAMWERIPSKYKRMSKKMSDLELQSFIKQQLPYANNETIARALIVIKGR